MSPALLLATVVPIACLAGATLLDRQGRRFVLLGIALAWGFACTAIVAPLNSRWAVAHGTISLVVLGAPIIEETVKAAVLPVLAAGRRCSWFVDGALLGLASGTGFAIRENRLYLRQAAEGTDLAVAIARVTSTNLMHAGCTAIVGAALAATIGRPLVTRLAVGPGGLVTAMALHSLFNRGAQRTGTAWLLTLLGIAVFGAAVGIVALGLPMSRKWAAASMAARGVAAGERAVMGGSGDVADLLDRFEARFGSERTALLESFIAVQRRIGVLSRREGRTTAATVAGPASTELDALHAEADELRRRIGLFPMGWLRSHLPVDPTAGMWGAIAVSTSPGGAPDVAGGAPGGLWASLADRDTGVASPGAGDPEPRPDP